MKLNRLETLIVFLIAILLLGTYVVSTALAEQSGNTPDSGEDSILMETYNTLLGLGYGTETGSKGPVWNRIISSAKWVPETGISEEDVRPGVEFYDGSRTLRTGSMKVIDWEKQSLIQKDNRDLTDYGETSSWIKTNASKKVWYDEITGLYWSASRGSMTNQFTISSCNFYTTTPRGNYDGTDADCGNAINTCGTLSLDADGDGIANTKWYLPTQLELMQAYVNGIYKKTNTSWVTGNAFWSSTELQINSSYAWYTTLYHGTTLGNTKTTSYAVRCVLRDL